jgi:GT2 family glycosyltransferase
MPKLSFIIVSYNTRDLLDACIKNLVNIYPNMEIIAVVNGDADGSCAMVSEKYPQVTLLKMENNGLAAAHNVGLARATGEYLVHLGTDAYPSLEAISQIVAYMEAHPDVGLATPKLVLRDGSVDIDAHRGFPTPWAALTHFAGLDRLFPTSKLFSQYSLGYKTGSIPYEIDVCISHFMFVRKSAQVKVGLWDEDYFLFGEDVDFCYRIKKAGYKIMYLANIEVLHYKGATIGRKTSKDIKTGAALSKEVKKKLPEQSTTAMKLFYAKHYSTIYPKPVTAFVFLGIYLLSRLRALLSKFA